MHRLQCFPLESSALAWPYFFGFVLSPVPLDVAGQEWLVADHPIVGIERVTVDGKPTTGWQLQQRLDDTGHPIAVLRLAQPTTTQPAPS